MNNWIDHVLAVVKGVKSINPKSKKECREARNIVEREVAELTEVNHHTVKDASTRRLGQLTGPFDVQLWEYINNGEKSLEKICLANAKNDSEVEKILLFFGNKTEFPEPLTIDDPIIGDEIKDGRGWVYLITHPTWKGWVKVGCTKNLQQRFQSYQTYSPQNYELIYFKESSYCLKLEQKIHRILRSIKTIKSIREWHLVELQIVRKMLDSKTN